MNRSPSVVQQVAAFAAGAFGDQDVGAELGGGMELDELQVLDRHAGHQGRADAAAGVDQGVGRVAVDPAVAAGGEDAEPRRRVASKRPVFRS